MLIMLLALTAGCSDKDSATDSGGADVQAIADANCGDNCHTGGSASGGLALDDFAGSTVSVPSQDVPEMNRVEPGDLDNSYLWHKLEGTHVDVGGDGSEMPLGQTLSDDDRSAIQEWIEDAG
ncbi:MAG TPA: hypothetical protein QGF58_01315 [Myxococcota bacterium]|nr:hypothetical protein [Myxococcota bacterium]